MEHLSDEAALFRLRGRPTARNSACSTSLSAATAAEMARRGPRPRVVEFAGVGHAPMLLAADQVDVVVAFLRGG